MTLSDVCLSVAYIGPKSRTERPRKTKIGTEVAHVTRDWDTNFKVKRSRSPGRFSHRGRQLQRSSWERIERGKLLLRCRLQARWSAPRREALRRPHREERGGACRVATRTVCFICSTIRFRIFRFLSKKNASKVQNINFLRFNSACLLQCPAGPFGLRI